MNTTLEPDAEAALVRLVPEHIRDAVRGYVTVGCPTGHFLSAVISNDLREACGRADEINAPRLHDIVAWFYQHAPGNCWGSPEAHDRWLAKHAERRAKAAQP